MKAATPKRVPVEVWGRGQEAEDGARLICLLWRGRNFSYYPVPPPRGKLKRNKSGDPRGGSERRQSPERARPSTSEVCCEPPGLGPASALVPGTGVSERAGVRPALRPRASGGEPADRGQEDEAALLLPGASWRAEGRPRGCWRSGRGRRAGNHRAPAAARAGVTVVRAASRPSAPFLLNQRKQTGGDWGENVCCPRPRGETGGPTAEEPW
ncbi:hypothetical protein NDU88_001260 [Pleurodeles waltl]|uniref:Uncharacterized protein n=1 Tax=Pleurodeles waltl TaxID=8319 RepID=A0AAV7SZU3_PLEWA|nr:hypothetical protein NDU88_001260 [Pleurodeles waltl]